MRRKRSNANSEKTCFSLYLIFFLIFFLSAGVKFVIRENIIPVQYEFSKAIPTATKKYTLQFEATGRTEHLSLPSHLPLKSKTVCLGLSSRPVPALLLHVCVPCCPSFTLLNEKPTRWARQ